MDVVVGIDLDLHSVSWFVVSFEPCVQHAELIRTRVDGESEPVREPHTPGVRCQYPRVEVMDALLCAHGRTVDARLPCRHHAIAIGPRRQLRTRALAARRGGISRHADDALCVSVSNHGDVGHRVVVIDIHHAFDEFVRTARERRTSAGRKREVALRPQMKSRSRSASSAQIGRMTKSNRQFGSVGTCDSTYVASHRRLRCTMDSGASGPLPTPRGSHPEFS